MSAFPLAPYGRFDRVGGGDAEELRIDLAGRTAGVHETEEVIFQTDGHLGVDWVISRTCDHAQGKLCLLDQDRAQCPLHKWTLDLKSRTYEGVGVSKPSLDFSIEGDVLVVRQEAHALNLVLPEPMPPTRVALRFLAHASVAIEACGLTIVTDPWLLGPCFTTGWWHGFPAKSDALDILKSADAVYISHNHPDHLHRETLTHIRRDMPLLVPDFPSRSVVTILEDEGFTDIRAMPFNTPFRVGDADMVLSLFQAGDFRDDSGLFVQAGDFSMLFSVDSNRLNSYVLPCPVDLVATSFASGASGFPLCFDVIPADEQDRIVTRNRHAVAAGAMEYIRTTQARYYMPYAGYFTESAPRDAAIKARNRKNSPETMEAMVAKRFPDVRVLNPITHDHLTFEHGDVVAETVDLPRGSAADEAVIAGYIAQELAAIPACPDARIVHYFESSGFKQNLILFLQPTDDDFKADGNGFRIDFTHTPPSVQMLSSDEVIAAYGSVEGHPSINTKLLHVRRGPLSQAIIHGLPWEDLSIGFQCRVHRKPNIYNAGFWYHFTNVYVGSKAGAFEG